MTYDLLLDHCPSVRAAPAPRPMRAIPISVTIAAVIALALAVTAAAIGIVQAQTLSEMVEDEAGRLALLGLILGIIMAGGIMAVIMWLTAPRPARRAAAMRVAPFRRTSATLF